MFAGSITKDLVNIYLFYQITYLMEEEPKQINEKMKALQ